MQIDLIGVPLDLGSERIGTDMAPNALRYQKLVANLQSSGLKIKDLGNLQCPSPENVEIGDPKIKYLPPVLQACRELKEIVKRSLEQKHKVLVLGGDHSVAMGSVAAAAEVYKSVGLVWIDAHGDMNTYETTPSGNIHGMPLAILLGQGHPKLLSLSAKGKQAIQDENMLAVGFKDMDKGELDLIKRKKLKTFFIRDILAQGLQPIFTAIEELSRRVDAVWVSFDLDAVDVDFAPGVGMPNKGGLTYREVKAVIEHLGALKNVVGLDLVEYNPVNDIQHKTAFLATELTAKVFGKEFSWYSQYLKEHAL